VWFDTYANAGSPDVSSNRIQISFDGSDVIQIDLEPLGFRLEDGNVHAARISCDGETLIVLLDGVAVASVPVPVGFVFPTNGFVRMSSFTGGAYANHDLLAWSVATARSLVALNPIAAYCQGASSVLSSLLAGGSASATQWRRGGVDLSDGPTPWGSIISGSATDTLTIDNIQPQDAGLYALVADTDCGTVQSEAVPVDVYCDCDPASFQGGLDDGFVLPRELTDPSDALRDALLNLRPDRPFHQFDQIPVVTSGVEPDSRLAHTFGDLPTDIIAARLTLRVRAGGTGMGSSGAEGTDSIRLGFATGAGAAAQEHRAWERRLGGTDVDPDLGLLAGELWERGDEALIELDLAALPLDRPLGDPGGLFVGVLDDLNANGFLDVTVVDETGVDFVRLEVVTSDGTVTPWVVGPQDATACEGGRAEFSATTGGVGGPFAYQWSRDGAPIDPATNPTASEATLVIDPVGAADFGRYGVVVTGDNTCGPAQSGTAMLRPCCRADLDGDGELTVFDFLAFLNAFDAADPIADFDGDGALTIFDFLAFQNAFDAGCQ
jgi:hypothetical protein